jgi:tRNA pseudouridine(55) synthase
MRPYVVIEKAVGQTPLQAIELYRKREVGLSSVPLTYAGRLDPMASGKLLVLIGDECKKRAHYDALDKEYVFEVLLGFTTDTGDVLGCVEAGGGSTIVSNAQVRDAIASLVGEHTLPYPVFSSKTVAGKALFQYALEGTLDTIQIPTIDVRVYSISFVDQLQMSRGDLISRVLNKIDLLKLDAHDTRLGADFRKALVTKSWWELQNKMRTNYTILRFRTTVSSGTYIRTLAPLIAEKLGTVGLAYSIRRTKIGCFFPITKRFGIWRRTF